MTTDIQRFLVSLFLIKRIIWYHTRSLTRLQFKNDRVHPVDGASLAPWGEEFLTSYGARDNVADERVPLG